MPAAALTPARQPRRSGAFTLYQPENSILGRLAFKTAGHEDWFYYYLSGMIFLSLLIYSTMRDTKHESAMHRHQ